MSEVPLYVPGVVPPPSISLGVRTTQHGCCGFVWRGTTTGEDAQGTPTQSHASQGLLVYGDKRLPPMAGLNSDLEDLRSTLTETPSKGSLQL